MKERRRHPRHPVSGMGIRAKTILGAEAEILDISSSGASLKCPRRLNMGGEYLFRFEHKNELIPVKGVVVRSALSGIDSGPDGESVVTYTAGVEFRDLPAEKSDLFHAFIAGTIKVLRERRLGVVKVKIHGIGDEIFEDDEICSVRDISLGGVRIETGRNVSAGDIFMFDLVLSEYEPPMFCRGRIAFSVEIAENEAKHYSVGVEFIGMDHEDAARLERFVDTLPPEC